MTDVQRWLMRLGVTLDPGASTDGPDAPSRWAIELVHELWQKWPSYRPQVQVGLDRIRVRIHKNGQRWGTVLRHPDWSSKADLQVEHLRVVDSVRLAVTRLEEAEEKVRRLKARAS